MKKIIALMLALMMIVPMFTVMASADGGTTSWDFEKLENTEGYEAITTEEQLKEIKPGGKYYLANDITLTDAYSAPNFNCYKTNGVCQDDTHPGDYACGITLHGNGYTIDIGTYNGNVFDTLPQGSDISNLTINGNITSTGGNTAGLAWKINGGYIHNIISNVNITDSDLSKDTEGTRAAGIIGAAYRSAITIENCINNGDITVSRSGSAMGAAGMLGYTGDIPVTIINCVNNGNITNVSDKSTGYAGGIAGNVRSNALSITNCTNSGTITAVKADQISAYNAPTEASGNLENGFALKFGEATVDKDYTDGSITLPDGSVFEFDTLTAEEIEEGGYIAVSTAAEFAAMTKDNKYYLVNDIDLTEASEGFDPTTFAPLNPRDKASTSADYCMVLHGNGKTVKTNVPLYANLGSGSNISNLRIEGEIKGLYNFMSKSGLSGWNDIGRATGAVAGVIRGTTTIRNIVNNAVIDATVDADGNAITATDLFMVGGIVGGVYSTAGGSIENCVNLASVKGATLADGGVGGILGRDAIAVTVKNCVNIGTVANTASGKAYAGGIFGNATKVSTIIYCVNKGAVEAADSLGGILGRSTNTTLINVKNTADLSDSSNYMGGIVGYSDAVNVYSAVNKGEVENTGGIAGGIVGYGGSCVITDSTNTGAVTASSYVGGMIARSYTTASALLGCVNSGAIESSGATAAGGMIGYTVVGANLNDCTNKGAVTTTKNSTYANAGGMIGHFASVTCTFTDCTNNGAVLATARSGGISGWANYTATYTRCVNNAPVASASNGNAFAGGIAGTTSSKAQTFVNCINNGKVSSPKLAGGIIGYAGISGCKVQYCLNAGNVTVDEIYIDAEGKSSTLAESDRFGAGGIVGSLLNSYTIIIEYSGVSGNVTNTVALASTNEVRGHGAGGFIGWTTKAGSSIKNSFFVGTLNTEGIDSSAKVGYIAGSSVALTTTTNVYVIKGDAITGDLNTNYTQVTDDQVKGGYLAYIMQNASTAAANTWGQNINSDPTPVLNGKEVKKIADAEIYYDGELWGHVILDDGFAINTYADIYDFDDTKDVTVTYTMNGFDPVEGVLEYKLHENGFKYADSIFSDIAPQYIGQSINIKLAVDDEVIVNKNKTTVAVLEDTVTLNKGNEKLKTLVESLLRYGYEAREYVINHRGADAEKIAVIDSELLDTAELAAPVDVPAVEYVQGTGHSDTFRIYSANVYFDNVNKMQFKFYIPADKKETATVTIGETVLTVAELKDLGNDVYLAETEGIYAKFFGNQETVVLKDGDTPVATVTYGIYNYAENMQDKNIGKLALATYHYGVTANDYYTASAKYTLGGEPLQDFVIVADSTANDNALEIADFVKTKHGINLDIVSAENYYFGNAILIDQGNTYGGVRYGIDTDISSSGDILIHIDGLSTYTSDMTDKFLENYLTTASNKNFALPEDEFYYEYASTVRNNGYLLNTATDVTRELAEGVTYIERTYTTATPLTGTATKKVTLNKEKTAIESITHTPADLKNTMYILILKANAKAHLEAYNAPYYTPTASQVSASHCNAFECGHSSGKTIYECTVSDYHEHVTPKTAEALANEMETNGKNVLAAFNAGFFMNSAKVYVPWGMQIVDGTVYREPRGVHSFSTSSNSFYCLNDKGNPTYSDARGDKWFGITKDGSPIISNKDTYESEYVGKIQHGLGGYQYLINNSNYQLHSGRTAVKINGEIVDYTGVGDALVAVGYNANGDIVIVATDGDNEKSNTVAGVTSADLTQIFMDLDMDITHALQFDGGGSTTVMVENESGVLTQKNTANGNDITNGVPEQRKIADIFAIVAD